MPVCGVCVFIINQNSIQIKKGINKLWCSRKQNGLTVNL